MIIDRIRKSLYPVEDTIASVALLLVAILPATEVVLRLFRTGIHGNVQYVQHLVIWVTFFGGMVTSRGGQHLALTAGIDLLKEPLQSWLRAATSAVAVATGSILTLNAARFVYMAFSASDTVGFCPTRLIVAVMPLGFGFITVRFVTHAPEGLKYKLVAASGFAAAGLLYLTGGEISPVLAWPLAILLLGAGLLGAPIFAVMGGIAAIGFATTGNSTLVVIPNEAYTMLTGQIIPTIPLFALTGFILSESKAGERLVEFFRAAFGWLPGGMAIMAVAVCAFFTTFTGASGVTILALGGLLSYVLVEGRYNKGFSTGLLTASGSIGLLFPPSLPIILYGVVAHVNIKHLFVAGLGPGVVMILALGVLGVNHALRNGAHRHRFDPRAALHGLTGAVWELALPFVILGCFLSGFTNLVETASASVVYALLVTVVIRRDARIRDVPRIALKCLSTVGGVLIILAVARGLSYYIIDVELPLNLAEWTSNHIHSKYIFLLLLNIALLVTGCLMDIFSAIVVVVPLIVPLGQAFDIHPVHLGIIFLANLELGYLTPPVGINLFLSSYRFEEPLTKVYRDVVPFLVALLVAVLLITYVPALTTAPLVWFGD